MKRSIAMKNILALVAIGLCAVVAASGQATISVEPYVAGYLSTTPHSAGGVNILAGSATASVVSYTSYEMRPLSLKMTPVAVGRTGVQWTVASNNKFDLSILGQAGGAGSNSAVSLAAAFGGKLVYLPGFKTVPGLYFTATLQGVGQSAALGGWNPEVTIGCGYSISGINLGTLSARRKMKAHSDLHPLPYSTLVYSKLVTPHSCIVTETIGGKSITRECRNGEQ
jgi:hypothetical protein